jgi:hypothetical protein
LIWRTGKPCENVFLFRLRSFLTYHLLLILLPRLSWLNLFPGGLFRIFTLRFRCVSYLLLVFNGVSYRWVPRFVSFSLASRSQFIILLYLLNSYSFLILRPINWFLTYLASRWLWHTWPSASCALNFTLSFLSSLLLLLNQGSIIDRLVLCKDSSIFRLHTSAS